MLIKEVLYTYTLLGVYMVGLNDEEVLINRKKYGKNIITKVKSKSFFSLLLESFGDPIIKILLIVLVIKILLLFQDENWFETIGILIAILLSSIISSLSEYASDKAFHDLEDELNDIYVLVIRNNNIHKIQSKDLVVNDIILLNAGDKICADGHIISGSILVNESSINGEYKEKKKNINDIVYSSSIIYDGSAKMIVDKVGDNTLIGNLAKELQEDSPISPLKIRLTHLAKIISYFGYIGSLLTVIIYLLTSNDYSISNILYALTIGITVIVVSVPEGLPMMITLVLSSNMKKMMKDNVLIRKLTGIETSGNINVLLTDKTGTLTNGKLNIISLVTYNNKYNSINELNSKLKEEINNNLFYNNSSLFDDDNNILSGNATDQAILKFSIKDNKRKVINKENFNSNNKYSLVTLDNNKTYIKGAPDIIINKCLYYLDDNGNKKIIIHNNILKDISNYTNKGIRVIALAEVIDNNLDTLIFQGYLLINDNLRATTKGAIKILNDAYINVIMITGDDINTARYIAKEAGIIHSNNDLVIDSNKLNSLSDNEIINLYPRLKVVARALPTDKTRLVSILENNNLVVGMTGDGINDAAALKKANVGFAMGTGTDVAKGASDIIILDDNINSICNAILYGRTIFKSIRKFIVFQLTVNLCAIILAVFGPILNIVNPITVVQMLWVNMIMDTLAGIAFAKEAPLDSYMMEKPINKDTKIINKYMYQELLITGLYSALLCLLFLKVPLLNIIIRQDNKYIMTSFFALFIFIGIFNALNARTDRINLFSNILKNKTFIVIFTLILIIQIYLIYYGKDLFRTYGLRLYELIYILLLSLTVIPIDIIRKIKTRYFN